MGVGLALTGLNDKHGYGGPYGCALKVPADLDFVYSSHNFINMT